LDVVDTYCVMCHMARRRTLPIYIIICVRIIVEFERTCILYIRRARKFVSRFK
jgi:hypothetical protein